MKEQEQNPWLKAHDEAVMLPRMDGRIKRIRYTWANFLENYPEQGFSWPEPQSNLLASLVLLGCGAIFGAVAAIVLIGLLGG